MAPPANTVHCITHSLVRPSLLHIALLLSCGLLIVQGAGSSSKATPLVRRERNAGCAQSCAQVSEMARCLRMACRKNAMGSLIRFGKRGRIGFSNENSNSAAGPNSPLTQKLPLPFQRGNILKKLLSRDDLAVLGDFGDDGEGLQGRIETDAAPERLPWVDSHAPLPLKTSHLPMLISPRHSGDLQLLLWLLKQSRDLHPQLSATMEHTPRVGDEFPLLHTSEDQGMPNAELLSGERPFKSGVGEVLSPVSYQDPSSEEEEGYSVSDSDQEMGRHQRGLPKHLIRFG